MSIFSIPPLTERMRRDLPAVYGWLEEISKLLRATSTIEVTITPASVAANTSAEFSFPAPGVEVGDQIIAVSPPASIAPVSIGYARVTGANSAVISFINPTAGAVIPTAGIYQLAVLRYRGN